MESKCPKCGSERVIMGSFPLYCQDCDWHYLNEEPCCVCGGPSRSTAAAYGVRLTWCVEHSPKDFIRESMEQLRKKAGPEGVRRTYEIFTKQGGW